MSVNHSTYKYRDTSRLRGAKGWKNNTRHWREGWMKRLTSTPGAAGNKTRKVQVKKKKSFTLFIQSWHVFGNKRVYYASRGAPFAIRVVWQLYIMVLQRSIYAVVTYCTMSEAYSSTRCSSNLHHVFTTQFLYSWIIVQIGIKTPIFAHIIVDDISPHLNLRFWG